MESANHLFLNRKLEKYVKNHASMCKKFIFASDFLFIYIKSRKGEQNLSID